MSENDKSWQRAGEAIDSHAKQRGIGLCWRCEHGLVYRSKQHARSTFFCTWLKREMPDDIVECTRYSDPHAMDMYTMSEIALKIDVRPGVHDKSYM